MKEWILIFSVAFFWLQNVCNTGKKVACCLLGFGTFADKHTDCEVAYEPT